MSTLVSTSTSPGGHRALVLRQPTGERLPAEARRGSGSASRALGQAFVIDGPPASRSTTNPIVVLAVNVVAGPGTRTHVLDAETTPPFAAFVPRVVGDPYASVTQGDRGTLVDSYV